MMKRLMPLAVLTIFISFTACDEIIPDIDKVVEQSYTVTIDADTPESVGDTVLVDITQYQEYTDYEQYISGYALNKITYEIVEFDAPEGLYFTGVILAYDTAMTTTVTVGEIGNISLSELYSSGEEQTMEQDAAASDQIIAWLDDPGNFKVEYTFSFKNADGEDYQFTEEEYGSTIKILVRFHLTILTGVEDGGLGI